MSYKFSSAICPQSTSKSHYPWATVHFKGSVIFWNKQDPVTPPYEILHWLSSYLQTDVQHPLCQGTHRPSGSALCWPPFLSCPYLPPYYTLPSPVHNFRRLQNLSRNLSLVFPPPRTPFLLPLLIHPSFMSPRQLPLPDLDPFFN